MDPNVCYKEIQGYFRAVHKLMRDDPRFTEEPAEDGADALEEVGLTDLLERVSALLMWVEKKGFVPDELKRRKDAGALQVVLSEADSLAEYIGGVYEGDDLDELYKWTRELLGWLECIMPVQLCQEEE